MNRTAACVAATLWLCLSQAWADGPADYVHTPAVEYGEREIDLKLGGWGGGQDRLGAASVGFGYGAKQWWFTEFYAEYERSGPGPTHFDAYEWENKFQLTETGKYPVDVGFVTEIERPQDHAEGYEVSFGPLFQTDYRRLQFNANLLLHRAYRAEAAGTMHTGYQWQAKYRWREQFEFGLQGFGELGDWNHWRGGDAQPRRAGPAVFGRIRLGGRQAIRYNAAYLIGTSSAAAHHTLRVQIEYEF